MSTGLNQKQAGNLLGNNANQIFGNAGAPEQTVGDQMSEQQYMEATEQGPVQGLFDVAQPAQQATGLFAGLPEQYVPQMEVARNMVSSPDDGMQKQGYELVDKLIGTQVGGNFSDSQKLQNDLNKKFMEEERKTASQDVRSFNTKARNMRTSYGQLQGLAEQAKSGDRGARNALTVTLARLISPGIVTEAEAAGLSGGQSIMQYVLQRASTGDANTDNVLKSLDPYGQNFNTDAMLKIGNSVVASGRKPLIDMYEGSRDRASASKMSERAFNTNFGANKNYDFLSNFGAGDATQQDKQGGKRMEDANGNKAIVYPDGSFKEIK